MRKSKPSVTYVYRGLGCDVPWKLLMREITECMAGDVPMTLVINCAASGGKDEPEFEERRVSEYQETGILQRSEKRLTIVDVARLAGVSRMTVSRVLNNRDGVSPRIHAHVRAVAEAVGYSLNDAAQALARGRPAQNDAL